MLKPAVQHLIEEMNAKSRSQVSRWDPNDTQNTSLEWPPATEQSVAKYEERCWSLASNRKSKSSSFIFCQLMEKCLGFGNGFCTSTSEPPPMTDVLRRCLHSLNGSKDLNFVYEKSPFLLQLLQGLCCFDGDEDEHHIPLRCSLLEVFADEILLHRHVAQHLTKATYYFPLFFVFANHYHNVVVDVGIGAVMDLMSAHFLLSTHGNHRLVQFHRSLYCSPSYGYDNGIASALSLDAILILLSTRAVLSAPKLLQAHLLLLASKAVGGLPIHEKPNNMLLLNNYIAAFDQSLRAYKRLLLKPGSCFPNSPTSKNSHASLSFHYYVHPDTYNRLTSRALMFDQLYGLNLQQAPLETKQAQLRAAMSYVEEMWHVVHESHRAEVSRFLKFVLLEKNTSCKTEDRKWDDICCIASVLKLMSSLLLQIVQALGKYGSSSGGKHLQNCDLPKEYKQLSGIISLFVHSCRTELVPIAAHDPPLQTTCASYGETKVLLLHFTGLFISSLDRGTECLWKGCIFLMLVLFNLLILEEGSLDSLPPFFGYTGVEHHESSLPYSTCRVDQDKGYRRSSFIIASNFQKIKNLVQKNQDYSQQEAKRYNEKLMMFAYGFNEDDMEELGDFLECKPERDYLAWEAKLAKFNKWKAKKGAAAKLKAKLKRTSMKIKMHPPKHRRPVK